MNLFVPKQKSNHIVGTVSRAEQFQYDNQSNGSLAISKHPLSFVWSGFAKLGLTKYRVLTV